MNAKISLYAVEQMTNVLSDAKAKIPVPGRPYSTVKVPTKFKSIALERTPVKVPKSSALVHVQSNVMEKPVATKQRSTPPAHPTSDVQGTVQRRAAGVILEH